MNIEYKSLHISELHERLLQDFERFQITNSVWFKTDVGFSVKEDHFIDQWDHQKKKRVIEDLKTCLRNGGIVYGAFADNQLAGFANVENRRFGEHYQYVELPYIHVSKPFRGYGIGKGLFTRCCTAAKYLGAQKLYIAAHPSVESQQFYNRMGCTFAEEVNKEISDREPLDLQLEYCL